MQLANARILITGASGGIGAAVAHALAQRGARLFITGRDAGRLRATAEYCGAASLIADLTAEADQLALVTAATAHLGGLDALVNVAGVLAFTPFEQMEPADIARLIQTNLVIPMQLTRRVLPDMIRQRQGRIVNVGSIIGSLGLAFFTAYAASKFGLRGFSQALRRELADSGVGVTYVAPRATRTTINTPAIQKMGEATGMAIDSPDWVAEAVVRAMQRDAKDVYLGWPEKFFVRLNALLPALVDRATASQSRTARRYADGG